MSDSAVAGVTILLVEDDPAIADIIREVVEANGYGMRHVESGAAAKAALREFIPNLIILDLRLPDTDGLVLCHDLKGRPELARVPIIICSARHEEVDVVLGLDLGADDFIPKPFFIREVEARIKVALRRTARGPALALPGGAISAPSASADHYRVGELHIDLSRRQVTVGETSLILTPIEYRILCALASQPGEALSRQDLARSVWGYRDAAGIERSINVHVHRLRVKLADCPRPTPPIVAVRGYGYRMERGPGDRAPSAASRAVRTSVEAPAWGIAPP